MGSVDKSLHYVGCYMDRRFKRQLVGYSTRNANMTPEACVDLCKSKGFKHAGVQNG